MNKTIPKIYGDRICLQCKGICHDRSYRKKISSGYGFRSHYFCSWYCVRNYYSNKYLNELRKLHETYNFDTHQFDVSSEFEEYEKKFTNETIENRYERVDVITKQDRINIRLGV